MVTIWQDMRSTDPKVAQRAIAALAGDPKQSVPFLFERLGEAKKDGETVMKLFAQLNDQKFSVREAATAELTKLAWRAEPAPRQGLEDKLPEVRQRSETILTHLLTKGCRDDVDLIQRIRCWKSWRRSRPPTPRPSRMTSRPARRDCGLRRKRNG